MERSASSSFHKILSPLASLLAQREPPLTGRFSDSFAESIGEEGGHGENKQPAVRGRRSEVRKSKRDYHPGLIVSLRETCSAPGEIVLPQFHRVKIQRGTRKDESRKDISLARSLHSLEPQGSQGEDSLTG
jgi:hypothetical protein